MPKLLIITYHFPPSAASGTFRLLGFAQHLPKFGWETIVVAPPSLPWEPTDPALSQRVPPQTVIVPVPYPRSLPKVIRWMAPYAVWLPYARRAARRAVREHQPDAVLTSGPPHWVHLLGRYLQKRYKLPWVADFRDPWITTSFGLEMSSIQKRIELGYERRTFRRADLILHNAPNACVQLQAIYPTCASRMVTLTNGYDPESFPPRDLECGDASPHSKKQEDVVRILHAGQLYAGRDPLPLLDAVASVPAEVPPFRVEFLGRTEYVKGADLAADARQRGAESRILLRGQASYQQTLGEMCQADILLLMDTLGRKIGVPAKLYEYLGAGRPILAAGEPDGDLSAILKASSVPYRLVPPNDVAALRGAIIDLVKGVREGTLPPASDEARRKFSREALTGQLAAMLNQLRGATKETP